MISEVPTDSGPSTAPHRRAVDRFCDLTDRVNSVVGQWWALSIFLVVLAVLIEVLARSLVGQATSWSNETTVYVSAVAYLMGGGYAMAHRRHVRIDLIYDRLSPRSRGVLDCLTFVFFLLYIGSLLWVGSKMGWMSFQQGEGTGTPWNPPIWPVKLAIPVAALLLLLQGIANLLRDLGIASSESKAS